MALKPDSLYQMTPDSLKLKYESLKITTPDSLNLQVWKIIPELKVKNNSTIILAYGDSGNMSYWLTTIRKFKNLKSPLFLVSTKKTNIHGTLQTM